MENQGLETIDLTSIILEPSSTTLYRGFFSPVTEINKSCPILCQIVSMDDIARSCMELVEAIDTEIESRTTTNNNNNNNQQQVIYFVEDTEDNNNNTVTSNKSSILDSPTCLKLTLQDLYGKLVYALLPINNIQSAATTLMLPRLSTTHLGAKLLIYGDVQCKREMLFLNQASVKLLSHRGIPEWNQSQQGENNTNAHVARLQRLRKMILSARELNK